MSVKKTTKKELAKKKPVKVDKPLDLEHWLDMYFTAEVQVREGSKNIVKKIRGQVISDSRSVYLANCQHGDYIDDCDSDIGQSGYARQIYIRETTYNNVDDRELLKDRKISNFKIVKDQRIIKIIKSDMLPEVAGFIALVDNEQIRFGCGKIEYDVEEVEMWSNIKRALDDADVDIYDFQRFNEMNEDILGQITEQQLFAIDPDDIDRIIKASKN